MLLPHNHAFGSDLASVAQLNLLAGDFWAYYYGDQSSLYAISGGVRQEMRQTKRRLHEVAAMCSHTSAYSHRHETYWPLLINPANVSHAPVVYGQEDAIFGGTSPPTFFGEMREDRWTFPLSDELRGFTAICDRIVSPSLVLCEGTDCSFLRTGKGNRVEMGVNPLERFRQVTTTLGDRLLCWLYMGRFEQFDFARRFGVLVDLYQESSSHYIQAVRTALNTWTGGPTDLRLRELLAASVGEVVAEEGEKVELVLTDRATPIVVTDRRQIKGVVGKTTSLKKGDELVVGDFFFDTVKYSQLTDETPDWAEALTLPAHISGDGTEVKIPNQSRPVIISTCGAEKLSSNFGSGHFWEKLNEDFPDLAAQARQHVGSTSNPVMLNFADFLRPALFSGRMSVSLIDTRYLRLDATDIFSLLREVLPPWLSHTIEFTEPPKLEWDGSSTCGPRTKVLYPPE